VALIVECEQCLMGTGSKTLVFAHSQKIKHIILPLGVQWLVTGDFAVYPMPRVQKLHPWGYIPSVKLCRYLMLTSRIIEGKKTTNLKTLHNIAHIIITCKFELIPHLDLHTV